MSQVAGASQSLIEPCKDPFKRKNPVLIIQAPIVPQVAGASAGSAPGALPRARGPGLNWLCFRAFRGLFGGFRGVLGFIGLIIWVLGF